MFTGLITDKAEILSVDDLGEGKEAWVASSIEDLVMGESIAVNGACTTVAEIRNHTQFKIQLLKETLDKTTFGDLKVGAILNVERSLRLSDRMGGHWVTGHVDCRAHISEWAYKEPWTEMTISYPQEFAHLLVEKGSIAVDGISLTVGKLGPDFFTCFLIPHTLQNTNLGFQKKGNAVNLEFDLIGKYIQRRTEVAL